MQFGKALVGNDGNVILMRLDYQDRKYYNYFGKFADIYDDLISRRVNSSDAEKFAECVLALAMV